MNTNQTKYTESLDQLKLLIYPEALEVSKISSILTDDLSFKVEELYNLKEIQKIVSSKEILIEILNSLSNEGILNLNNSEGQILLKDNLILYNFINVPNKMKYEQLTELLGIKEGDIMRLYKQSLYWIMVSENEEFNSSIENKLRSVMFGDVNLKFDITNGRIVRKQILKKIQNYNYIKETDELKAVGGPSLSANNPRKESFNRAEKVSTTNSTEAFSWRKKSDVSNNSSRDDISGTKKTVSNFNSSVNDNNSSGSKFIKRERFNSDPNSSKFIPIPSKFETSSTIDQEIIIDPKLVKYPIEVVYKYSTREIHQLYEKNKNKITNDSFAFKIFIDEVCNYKSKEISSCIYSVIRKNSYETTMKTNLDVKSSILSSGEKSEKQVEKILIPKNNPLQELGTNLK